MILRGQAISPPDVGKGDYESMQKLKITLVLILFVLTSFLFQETVLAIPPLPSSFYGTVSLNGTNVVEGTVVEVLIDDKVIGESQTLMYEGKSVYSIDVNGDDSSTPQVEGGKEGDLIYYRIGGLLAKETGTWHSGVNFELNLTINAQATLQPPQPTKTPIPTQTPIKYPTRAVVTATVIEPTKQATQAVNQNQGAQPTASFQASQIEARNTPTEQKTTPEMAASGVMNDEMVQTSTEKTDQELTSGTNSKTGTGESGRSTFLEKKEEPDRLWPEAIVLAALVILIVAVYVYIKSKNNKN